MIKYIFLAFVAICFVFAGFGIVKFFRGGDAPKLPRNNEVQVKPAAPSQGVEPVAIGKDIVEIIPAYRVGNGFIRRDEPHEYFRQGVVTKYGRVVEIRGVSMICQSGEVKREIWFDLVDVQQCEFRGFAWVGPRYGVFTDLGFFVRGEASPVGGVVTAIGPRTVEIAFPDQTRLVLVGGELKPIPVSTPIPDMPEIAGVQIK